MLSEEQVQLLYVVSPGGTNHQKQWYENMAYPSGYDMEWVQFLIQWPQQPRKEPMLCSEPNGSVESVLYIYIYIYHIEIRVKFRGGNKGVEELHTDELPHPPTLGTKQRWVTHHYHFTKTNNRRLKRDQSDNSSVFTFTFFFFLVISNDDHNKRQGGNNNTSWFTVSNRSP